MDRLTLFRSAASATPPLIECVPASCAPFSKMGGSEDEKQWYYIDKDNNYVGPVNTHKLKQLKKLLLKLHKQLKTQLEMRSKQP